MKDLLVKIVGEHKPNEQDGRNPQGRTVAAARTMLLQVCKTQAAQLIEQRNERHGDVVQVPQHGGIERRERLVFKDDLDHPQGTDGGNGNKAPAQDVIKTAQVNQHAPD